MNDPALQWLTERASQPGTLAWAVRRPDGNVVSQSADETYPAANLEKSLAKFDDLSTVAADQTAPQWSTWAFEQGRIRLVERPDGWRLALVVHNDSAAVSGLDSLSQEFLTMSLEV